MGTNVSSLTVMFEDPFWIGLYARYDNGRYSVCKITFGAEPKDREVYDFLLRNWSRLRFSPSVRTEFSAERRPNPKRMQRQINRDLTCVGIGTKAQQALKLQHSEGKQARLTRSREQREAESERRFAIRQEKRKEKHKGH